MSGQLATVVFRPAGWIRNAWECAKFLALRHSLLEESQPEGGVEVGLVDTIGAGLFPTTSLDRDTCDAAEGPILSAITTNASNGKPSRVRPDVTMAISHGSHPDEVHPFRLGTIE